VSHGASGVTQPLGALRQSATFGPLLKKIFRRHPPPVAKKIFGQCTILGVKKFSGHTPIFPKDEKNFPETPKNFPDI
jgi:hypothetical protein